MALGLPSVNQRIGWKLLGPGSDPRAVFIYLSCALYSYGTGSENIHYNYGYSEQQSIRVAVESWIDSPPHYASMVNPSLRRIGIGVATAVNGHTYYSVVFSD